MMQPPFIGATNRKSTRRALLLWILLLAVLAVIAIWGAWSLQNAIPRHIVLASGPPDGMYHVYAQRYKEILARDVVTVEERMTGGAVDNERLMLDPTRTEHPNSTASYTTSRDTTPNAVLYPAQSSLTVADSVGFA